MESFTSSKMGHGPKLRQILQVSDPASASTACIHGKIADNAQMNTWSLYLKATNPNPYPKGYDTMPDDLDPSTSALPTLTPSTPCDETPIAYKGQPVMTTERLAEALGATPKMLSDNYQNNKARFAEGDHLFVVKGDELKQLKASPKFSGQFQPTAPKALLWTERGAFRHAKCLNTPEAWQAYEKLEDTYFAVKAGRLLPAPITVQKIAPRYRDWLACAKLVGLKGNQAVVAANRATAKETGVNVLEGLGEIKLIETDPHPSYTVTAIAHRMGIGSPVTLNKLMEKHGFQLSRPDERPRWEPTPLGLPHAELVTVDPIHGHGKAQRQEICSEL
ncbi:conserved hypothetical protein [Azospirillaceae bacterium]